MVEIWTLDRLLLIAISLEIATNWQANGKKSSNLLALRGSGQFGPRMNWMKWDEVKWKKSIFGESTDAPSLFHGGIPPYVPAGLEVSTIRIVFLCHCIFDIYFWGYSLCNHRISKFPVWPRSIAADNRNEMIVAINSSCFILLCLRIFEVARPNLFLIERL